MELIRPTQLVLKTYAGIIRQEFEMTIHDPLLGNPQLAGFIYSPIEIQLIM